MAVVSTQWYGDTVLDTTYKSISGQVSNTLLYRDDEPRLSISEKTRLWSFDALGDPLRIVSEAYRIRLAARFDPLLAVHTSIVEPLAHKIVAAYEKLISRLSLRLLVATIPVGAKPSWPAPSSRS